MPRSGTNGTYSLPGSQAQQQPNTTIPSAVNNTGWYDVEQTFNTPQPIAYGGTGEQTAVGGIDALSTKGANIASAATTNIGAATGRFVHITGTANITSFGTKAAGVVRFLTFDDVLTLTHNATSLILPGAADIVTAAGDSATAISEGGGNWRFVAFQRASGQNIQPYGFQGQVYLALDGSNLRLSPFNGNVISINGINRSVPNAGIALAPTGLVASTVYYIYAFMSGTSIALEAVTTAPVLSNGWRIKPGDASRTLVGYARTSAAVSWVDDSTSAHVISYFNAKKKRLIAPATASRAFTSTSMALVSTDFRTFFLSHPNYAVTQEFIGSAYQSSANNRTHLSTAVDSTVGEGVFMQPADTGAYNMSTSFSFVNLQPGTAYTGGVFGAVSSGTSTIIYNTSLPGFRAVLVTEVWG